MSITTENEQLAYIASQAADARVNVEVETDEGMTLNLGPQHPATHGTLRIIAKLDGEKVEIFFNDTGSPALIKDPGDFDSIYVVMPMKG